MHLSYIELHSVFWQHIRNVCTISERNLHFSWHFRDKIKKNVHEEMWKTFFSNANYLHMLFFRWFCFPCLFSRRHVSHCVYHVKVKIKRKRKREIIFFSSNKDSQQLVVVWWCDCSLHHAKFQGILSFLLLSVCVSLTWSVDVYCIVPNMLRR